MFKKKKKTALIERIQSGPNEAAIVVAGGGLTAVNDIMSHPGASRFVLDVQVPYSMEAFIEYLGYKPESFCSLETAELLAYEALERAKVLKKSARPIGIAVTAALATTRVRRGADKAFICIASPNCVGHYAIDLRTKGRANQEAELSTYILNCIDIYAGA